MPESGRAETLLGFDYGSKRIGVAVGQRLTGTATALTTLPARDGQPDWDALGRLIDEWRPAALVVGLPLRLDGSESGTSEAARRFARRLEGRYHLPVHLMEEALSSVAAEEVLAQGGGKTAGGLDAQAARIILQNWLDEHG